MIFSALEKDAQKSNSQHREQFGKSLSDANQIKACFGFRQLSRRHAKAVICTLKTHRIDNHLERVHQVCEVGSDNQRDTSQEKEKHHQNHTWYIGLDFINKSRIVHSSFAERTCYMEFTLPECSIGGQFELKAIQSIISEHSL